MRRTSSASVAQPGHSRLNMQQSMVMAPSMRPSGISIFAILLLIYTIKTCDAQLISAYEQAYGSWKIRLTRSLFGKKWYLERPVKTSSATTLSSSSKANHHYRNSRLQILFPVIPERIKGASSIEKVRSVPCILTLEKNGKFSICIDESCTRSGSHDTSDEDSISRADSRLVNSLDSISTIEATEMSHYAPLQGEWYLTPNPYCVTDRHYDTLTLISEPRIRRAPSERGIITEMARIELRCKIWGRYGVGAVRNKLGLRHGREMGRMTHGTVLVVREYDASDGDIGQVSKREIVASFSGRACSNNVFDCEDDVTSADDDYSRDMDQDEVENEF